jgi:hypothetical protein
VAASVALPGGSGVTPEHDDRERGAMRRDEMGSANEWQDGTVGHDATPEVAASIVLGRDAGWAVER